MKRRAILLGLIVVLFLIVACVQLEKIENGALIGEAKRRLFMGASGSCSSVSGGDTTCTTVSDTITVIYSGSESTCTSKGGTYKGTDSTGKKICEFPSTTCDTNGKIMENTCTQRTRFGQAFYQFSACKRSCSPGQACQNGACVTLCGNGIVDTNENCASCPADAAQVEICDGIDNDCDTQIDEDFDLQTDTNNCGLCENSCPTESACESGQCVPLCIPVEEVCDGLDNNCNNQIDEWCDSDGDGIFDNIDNCPYMANSGIAGTLLEGETGTYQVNGASYEVSLTFVDTDEAKFTVNNGPTPKLKKDESYVLPDTSKIIVRDVLYQDYAGGIHSVALLIGAQKDTNQNGMGDACDPVLVPPEPFCDGIDNDGNWQIDEGCDDDDDNYCDLSLQTVGTPATCTAGGSDCDDEYFWVNPSRTENCKDSRDNNCDGIVNGGCTPYFCSDDEPQNDPLVEGLVTVTAANGQLMEIMADYCEGNSIRQTSCFSESGNDYTTIYTLTWSTCPEETTCSADHNKCV